jgi:hypothetical protein
MRITMLTMSAAPRIAKATIDSQSDRENANTTYPHADAAIDRVAGQRQTHQQRADRRRAAQNAEAPWAGMQNVARIDRQQCSRAAKQDGEQIERYRSQDRWIAANEADTGEQRGERRWLLGVDGPVELDRPAQNPGQKPERRHQRIRHAGRNGINQTAQCRPTDRRYLKGAGRQRGGALQHSFGCDAGEDGRRGRTLKRNGRAEHRDRGIDFRDCEPAGKAAPRQIRGRQSRGELGKLRHACDYIGRRRAQRRRSGAQSE